MFDVGEEHLRVHGEPGFRAGALIYFPIMPCSHQSGEVGMASFCRVDSQACRLPSMLGALEEHDFLFQLHLDDMPQDDSNEVCANAEVSL